VLWTRRLRRNIMVCYAESIAVARARKSRMIPAGEIRDPEVRASAEAARAYLEHFRWCGAITQLSLAFAVAGVVSVFRADIRPVGEGADPTVWVVMGDLPPAYTIESDV